MTIILILIVLGWCVYNIHSGHVSCVGRGYWYVLAGVIIGLTIASSLFHFHVLVDIWR